MSFQMSIARVPRYSSHMKSFLINTCRCTRFQILKWLHLWNRNDSNSIRNKLYRFKENDYTVFIFGFSEFQRAFTWLRLTFVILVCQIFMSPGCDFLIVSNNLAFIETTIRHIVNFWGGWGRMLVKKNKWDVVYGSCNSKLDFSMVCQILTYQSFCNSIMKCMRRDN